MQAKNKYLVTSVAGMFPVVKLGPTLKIAMKRAGVNKDTEKNKYRIYKVAEDEIVEIRANGQIV